VIAQIQLAGKFVVGKKACLEQCVMLKWQFFRRRLDQNNRYIFRLPTG